MNTATFKTANICFSYSRHGMIPQIPRITDVLFALRLSNQEEYYSFGYGNHPSYIANVHLVACAVSNEIMSMSPRDEKKAKPIIARAIVELCPEEAKCLFNSAFVQAKAVAGEEVPPVGTLREKLLALCGCVQCKEQLPVF